MFNISKYIYEKKKLTKKEKTYKGILYYSI